jgi:hypothetical protein
LGKDFRAESETCQHEQDKEGGHFQFHGYLLFYSSIPIKIGWFQFPCLVVPHSGGRVTGDARMKGTASAAGKS